MECCKPKTHKTDGLFQENTTKTQSGHKKAADMQINPNVQKKPENGA